ncbi:unnamed protein product [Cladocopium goreaui]|uniref:Uncharacterized protein n=1 Tax=Cladocopium goreaui TaxID=2562237 RepID=A0A9P1DWE3_9DINO|nr:unnamed protein product [Cladocopium goreaui]
MSLKILVPFPVRGDLVPFVPPDAAAAFPAVRSKESGVLHSFYSGRSGAPNAGVPMPGVHPPRPLSLGLEGLQDGDSRSAAAGDLQPAAESEAQQRNSLILHGSRVHCFCCAVAKILASHEPEEVLELCAQHLAQFDMVNLPTSWGHPVLRPAPAPVVFATAARLQCLARMSVDPSDAPHDLLINVPWLDGHDAHFGSQAAKTCSISTL